MSIEVLSGQYLVFPCQLHLSHLPSHLLSQLLFLRPGQLSSNVGLDRLRDQMKLLKRMCRLRTMMSWKQQRIQLEQELSIAYRDSMAALQQEAEALEVSFGVSVAGVCKG